MGVVHTISRMMKLWTALTAEMKQAQEQEDQIRTRRLQFVLGVCNLLIVFCCAISHCGCYQLSIYVCLPLHS